VNDPQQQPVHTAPGPDDRAEDAGSAEANRLCGDRLLFPYNACGRASRTRPQQRTSATRGVKADFSGAHSGSFGRGDSDTIQTQQKGSPSELYKSVTALHPARTSQADERPAASAASEPAGSGQANVVTARTRALNRAVQVHTTWHRRHRPLNALSGEASTGGRRSDGPEVAAVKRSPSAELKKGNIVSTPGHEL